MSIPSLICALSRIQARNLNTADVFEALRDATNFWYANTAQQQVGSTLTLSSEQFLAARSLMAPAFQHNILATKMARISNLHAEAPN